MARAESPGGTVTCQAALAEASRALAAAGCEQARLDAELLLAHALGVTRGYLYAHPERRLTPGEATAWHALLTRRLGREPMAYILGHREFHGLDLIVDRRVLVPRPESELIVERVLTWAGQHEVRTVWDAGTGSGALALALVHHLPQAHVVASDISADALAVAALNRQRLGLERVQLVRCDLLACARGALDVVVANLPYLTSDECRQAMPEVSRHEPRGALDGGPAGLDLVARLLVQAAALDPPPALILLEIGAGQGEQARALARECFPRRSVAVRQDLAGLDRVVEIAPHPPAPSPTEGGRGEAERPPLSHPKEKGLGGEDLSPLPPCRRGGASGRGAGGEGRLLPASDPATIPLAAEALRCGAVVAFPTDTVYGLGAAVFREEAVQALYEIKGRPEGKAIPLLLASAGDLPRVALCVPPGAERLVRRYWPGPLTLVLPARPEIPAVVRAGGPTVAVRVPDHPVARALIEAVGTPLATTSANRSGAPEALTAHEVIEQLGDGVTWVIDGGRSPGGIPSTVIDLTVDPPVIRRQGAIAGEELLAQLAESWRLLRKERSQ